VCKHVKVKLSSRLHNLPLIYEDVWLSVGTAPPFLTSTQKVTSVRTYIYPYMYICIRVCGPPVSSSGQSS
jgi:hypothetical protein